MQLLFGAKWAQISRDLCYFSSEPDNYNELLAKAECDYDIFNQYYLSSGHLSTEYAEILEQWEFMIHHLRAYQNNKSEGAVTNLRDYAIRNELIEKIKNIKTKYPYRISWFFHGVIDEGTEYIESVFAKLEEYKSRIKDGLTHRDFHEIMELAGDIYDKGTMNEKERLINTIELIENGSILLS
jgi:hypothetical protein